MISRIRCEASATSYFARVPHSLLREKRRSPFRARVRTCHESGRRECDNVLSLGRRVRSVRRRLFEIPGRWPGLLRGGGDDLGSGTCAGVLSRALAVAVVVVVYYDFDDRHE